MPSNFKPLRLFKEKDTLVFNINNIGGTSKDVPPILFVIGGTLADMPPINKRLVAHKESSHQLVIYWWYIRKNDPQ